jgi:hypothetical protein
MYAYKTSKDEFRSTMLETYEKAMKAGVDKCVETDSGFLDIYVRGELDKRFLVGQNGKVYDVEGNRVDFNGEPIDEAENLRVEKLKQEILLDIKRLLPDWLEEIAHDRSLLR